MSLPADLSFLQGRGGAEREAALATLEKQLTCPICLEIFTKPVVILPCQHNLCRKCANELYQPSLFQPRTTMLINSGRFRCPTCRQEVVLDRHGVYGLQRNLLVENIIDAYKQELSTTTISSSSTGSSPLPLPPAQPTCSDHEGEKVNIYCLSCQRPTCSLCKVFGAHQACRVAPLTDVYQEQREELQEGISCLVATNDKVQALINQLEESCRNIEENGKTQKQRVCDQFSRMFSILEERRKVMTERISCEEEEKAGHAQALARCYGDAVEANSRLVERASGRMEEPDMAALVESSRELIPQLMAAAGLAPAPPPPPARQNLSSYTYHFSRQERALRSLDFQRDDKDVPPEEPEPSEPKEPKPPPETSTQNLEPLKEQNPLLIAPPAEPVLEDTTPALINPDPAREEPDLLDLNQEGPGQTKVQKVEEEQLPPGAEQCAASCDQHDGFTTQQWEGGASGSEAPDWLGSRSTEEMHVRGETDASFYPGWWSLYSSTFWPSCSSCPDSGRTSAASSSRSTSRGRLTSLLHSSDRADRPLPSSPVLFWPRPLWPRPRHHPQRGSTPAQFLFLLARPTSPQEVAEGLTFILVKVSGRV